MRIQRTKWWLPMLVAGAAVLNGCAGNTGDSTPSVASVAQQPSAGSSPSAAAVAGVQARLDTTQEELDSWYAAYNACLKSHGTKIEYGAKAPETGYVAPGTTPSPEALAACASKKVNPVPPEMDPQQNPEYKQQWHEAVKCLQGKGMPIVETADGWTYSDTDADIPENAEELERQCNIEAFSGK